MKLLAQYKSYSKKEPLKARLLLSVFIILITLAVLRVLLPVAIKVGAYYWFDSNKIDADIGKIEISLFSGSFAINNVSGKSQTGKNFSLGQFKVSWNWKPLFSKTAFINDIEINALKADAAFYKAGKMNIAGIVIDPAANKETKKAVAEKSSTPWGVSVHNIKLSGIEFCMQQYADMEKPDLDYCSTLGQFNWNGNIDFKPLLQAKTPNAVPLYINGSLKLDDLALKNNKINLDLLDIKNIDIKDVNIQTPLDIKVAQVGINNFTALQRNSKAGANDAQLAAFDQLLIQPISLQGMNNLKLGTVKLDGTQVFFQVDKTGHTDFARWLPPKSKQAPETKEKQQDKSTAEPFNFSLGAFDFNTSKQVTLVDDSLKEPFKTYLHNIDLKVEKLDSQKPGEPAHATLSFKIEKYATFKVDAELKPFAKKLSLKGKGEIAGLDLRMLAPFTKKYVGHDIKSGQLDSKINLGVKNGIIDSKIGLTLQQFELKALSKKEAEELNSEFGFPLNSALSLLRDRDNAIRLDIPVKGDTSNPEFDPSDAIIKASSSAITSAVIQYYTPFGLVFAAGALFDLATALSFEPVIFTANEAVLTPPNMAQLDKLVTLMNERPGVHLTLCGISNKQDKDVLFPGLKQSDAANADNKTEEKPLAKDKLDLLKKLAGLRSSVVKNFLVNKNINASRLIECSPEFKLDGIAGVEISI